VVSVMVAVSVAVPLLPAASRAVIVSTLAPGCSAMPLAVQLVVRWPFRFRLGCSSTSPESHRRCPTRFSQRHRGAVVL